MKKTAVVLILILTVCSCFAEQGSTVFTDSCGRSVKLPSEVTRVAVSGAVASRIMTSLAPQYMCNVNSKPSENQKRYLPGVIFSLPVTGQLYGGKSSLNLEEILSTGAQVILDMGSMKQTTSQDMDALQKKTGIPCIFIECDFDSMAGAFLKLGDILKDRNQRALELAMLVEETMKKASEAVAKIPENERLSVMLGGETDGLGVNPEGSEQARILGIIGADNCVVLPSVNNRANGNRISMEQLYVINPEVIVFSSDVDMQMIMNNPSWKVLDAVKNRRVYQAPALPYNWINNPPSLNMIAGIWWLGNLLYPGYFDYDAVAEIQRVFKILWNCDLSYEEVGSLVGQ